MPNLVVRLETGTQTAGDGQELQEQAGVQKKDNKKMALTSALTNFAISQGKAILSASISQIGITTGDYIKQEQIQRIVGYAQDAIGVGAAFLVNPIVGGMAVASLGVKYAIQISNDIKQVELENTKISYMRDRSGNATLNGSRTGD